MGAAPFCSREWGAFMENFENLPGYFEVYPSTIFHP